MREVSLRKDSEPHGDPPWPEHVTAYLLTTWHVEVWPYGTVIGDDKVEGLRAMVVGFNGERWSTYHVLVLSAPESLRADAYWREGEMAWTGPSGWQVIE
jgi:hypothetical protein